MRRLLFAVLLLWGGGAWAETATLTPDPGSCIASLTGCTIVGPVTAPSLTTNAAPSPTTAPLTITSSGACTNATSTFCTLFTMSQTVTSYSTTGNRGTQLFETLNLGGTNSGTWESNFFSTTIAAGTTTSGEVNGFHDYMQIQSGATVSGGTSENFEASVDNYGTQSGSFSQHLAIWNNQSSATTAGVNGLRTYYVNYNSTAASVGKWDGVLCSGYNGTGSHATFANCIENVDPTAEILTEGHIAFTASTAPTLTNCGTGATIDSQASDTMGTVTEGTGATGCTVNFAYTYVRGGNYRVQHVIISAPTAMGYSGYTVSNGGTNGTLVITNTTPGTFTYFVASSGP